VARERRTDDALDAAARLLRHSDRSRAELTQRLAQRGFDERAAAEALETLERVGVVDDERTAALRAETLAGRGYGNAFIRADLRRRRLPPDEALAALEPEVDRARRLVEARGATPTWLARRGFDADVVESVAHSGPGAVG
jgi:regulatory protein